VSWHTCTLLTPNAMKYSYLYTCTEYAFVVRNPELSGNKEFNGDGTEGTATINLTMAHHHCDRHYIVASSLGIGPRNRDTPNTDGCHATFPDESFMEDTFFCTSISGRYAASRYDVKTSQKRAAKDERQPLGYLRRGVRRGDNDS
jgi:hypothetical protein